MSDWLEYCAEQEAGYRKSVQQLQELEDSPYLANMQGKILAELADLRAKLEAAERERDRLAKLLYDLTIGGSEFVGNPDRCAASIRESLSNGIRQTVKASIGWQKAKAERDALAAEAGALRKALEPLADLANDYLGYSDGAKVDVLIPLKHLRVARYALANTPRSAEYAARVAAMEGVCEAARQAVEVPDTHNWLALRAALNALDKEKQG